MKYRVAIVTDPQALRFATTRALTIYAPVWGFKQRERQHSPSLPQRGPIL